MHRVVTRCAIHRFRSFLELSRVDVLVAPDAFLGRRLKPDLADLYSRDGRRGPVAIDAIQNAVPAQQGERRGPVIKGLQFAP